MRTSTFGEVAAKLGFLSRRGTSFAWAPKSGTIVRLLFASDGGCSSVVEHLIVVQDVASSNLVSHPTERASKPKAKLSSLDANEGGYARRAERVLANTQTPVKACALTGFFVPAQQAGPLSTSAS